MLRSPLDRPIGPMLRFALRNRINVITALVLRDMRTRFGRSHLGYLLAIMWPLSHLTVMVGGMVYMRRVSPLGGDPVVFAVTGILPYILCLYPARMMGYAMELNRALLFFPVIRPMDIIVSRAIVELFTASIVVLLVFSIALVAGFDLVPMDSHILVSGIMATVFLSLSMGFFNNIALSISKAWNIIFVTLLISMYISSGVVIPVAVLPEEIQYIISFNPLFHSVEWLRSAYFEDSSYYMLSKTYLLGVGLAFMLLGLMGERFLRGKMLVS